MITPLVYFHYTEFRASYGGIPEFNSIGFSLLSEDIKGRDLTNSPYTYSNVPQIWYSFKI